MPNYALGIDIGGTFTDIVVYDHDTGRRWRTNKVMEGAFIWAPLRIIGATGSPGNPVVLYEAVALQALLNR
ncbi:MAG: hypothetical protein DME07_09270 [Candidatus Rokuibacteriota bacterium]|nr:MAG: hypothetical protein DME07_09270 [Candidatus Rokubacteria bacterium]PYN56975.1 MAG: hypothetical protein DMD94_05785 [Candidatus Rokubacteria bacterium]